MASDRWSEVISRLTAGAPEPLDDLLADTATGAGLEGADFFPPLEAVLMPQAAMRTSGAVAIGVRVTEPVPDLVDRALRLAAFALEKDVEVIVLSHIDEPGFERFGFRVERIAGADDAARAACEDQIRRFWNIDLVL
jgi:hypothetical protein